MSALRKIADARLLKKKPPGFGQAAFGLLVERRGFGGLRRSGQ